MFKFCSLFLPLSHFTGLQVLPTLALVPLTSFLVRTCGTFDSTCTYSPPLLYSSRHFPLSLTLNSIWQQLTFSSSLLPPQSLILARKMFRLFFLSSFFLYSMITRFVFDSPFLTLTSPADSAVLCIIRCIMVYFIYIFSLIRSLLYCISQLHTSVFFFFFHYSLSSPATL